MSVEGSGTALTDTLSRGVSKLLLASPLKNVRFVVLPVAVKFTVNNCQFSMLVPGMGLV